MERAEEIKLKVKALLNETAEEPAKRSRWRERILAAAVMVQAVALFGSATAREPLYLGMDPYGQPVVAAPQKPLTGRVYGEVDYTPGTKLIPSQAELKERTAVEFSF